MLCTKYPSIHQIVLRLIVLAIFLFPVVTCAQTPKAQQTEAMGDNHQNILLAKADNPVPKDFTMVIHTGPRMQRSPVPALFLSLYGKGLAKYYETNVNGKKDFSLVKEFVLDATVIQRIYSIVMSERFFELKPQYNDPEVMDGDFAQIEINANGKSYRVRTVNIKVDAFDRIITAVNNYLPKGVILYYNAITVDSYKRVER